MCVQTAEAGLESGLPIDQIEARLCAAARCHHADERNIAYWLLEIDRRELYQERGFSSVGDYAFELAGIKPRKARYLVFIARRLEKLPRIRDAFDCGDLSWTKAREIVDVATPDTEAQWLERAASLNNRDLEKEVRRVTGRGAGEFVSLTISMPVEVFSMWNDTYELAERISGMELEKWQVLEPALAEFVSTHLPAMEEGSGSPHETDEETALLEPVRNAVFDRDGWKCAFPGCTMRKMLDAHHVEFRSHGGDDDLGNLVCLCRVHHALIHRGICKVTGTVGVDLKFERPRLFPEAREEKPVIVEEPAALEAESPQDEAPEEDDESWRDECVAEIFDGPRPPKPRPQKMDYGDFIADWIEQKQARGLRERAAKRRARGTRVPRAQSTENGDGSTCRGAEESHSESFVDLPGG